MAGIITRKSDMTRLLVEEKFVPVTLLVVPTITVAEQRTELKNGYVATVLKATHGRQSILREVTTTGALADLKVGDEVSLDLLDAVTSVTLHSVSKGKGFAGAMKRHNFKGGPGGHGSKFHRALGSIGCRKPRRTKPGQKMHGHMGVDMTTLKEVPVVAFNKDLRTLAVAGPVPGARNGYVVLDF